MHTLPQCVMFLAGLRADAGCNMPYCACRGAGAPLRSPLSQIAVPMPAWLVERGCGDRAANQSPGVERMNE